MSRKMDNKCLRGIGVLAFLLVCIWPVSGSAQVLGRLVADGVLGNQTAQDGATYTSGSANTWYAINGKTITGGLNNTVINTSASGIALQADVGSIIASNLTVSGSYWGAQITNGGIISLASSTINAAQIGAAAYSGGTFAATHSSITGSMGLYVKFSGNAILADSAIVGTKGDGVQSVGNSAAPYNYLRLTNVTINAAVCGIRATTGRSVIDLTNVTVNTQGTGSGYGIQADTGSTIHANGLDITTADSASRGIYAAVGSDIHLTGSINITTKGADAHGLLARYATSSAYNPAGLDTRIIADADAVLNIDIKGGNLLMPTNGVQVQYASGDSYQSTIELNGMTNVTIESTAYGYGFFATGSNTSISAQSGTISSYSTSGHGMYASTGGLINAQNFTITSTGNSSYGAYAGNSGTVNLQNSTISSKGNTAYGMYAVGKGLVTSTNNTVTTQGNTAYGIYATGTSSIVNARSTQVNTSGSSAVGAFAAGGGWVQLNAATIKTSGVAAHGLVISGSSSDIQTDAASSVTTSGSAAHGIQAINGANKTYDGSAGNVLPQVKVSGQGAAVLAATGTGSQLTVKNTALNTAMTSGVDTWGAKAENGGAIIFGDNASSGGTGLWAANKGVINMTGNAAGNGSRVVVDTGGKFDMSTVNGAVTVGSIEGSGLIDLGDKTLRVGGYTTTADSMSTVFSGTIQGSGNLIKQGAGVLTLQGLHAFDYTGFTRIDDGVLAIRGLTISECNAFTKTITLNGGWLDLSDMNPGDFPNPKDGNAQVIQWDHLTLLSGANAQVPNCNGGVIGANDRLTYNVNGGSAVVVQHYLGSATTNPGLYGSQGIYVVKTGEGTLELAGANEYIGNTRVEGGILLVRRDENLGDVTAHREVVLGNQTDMTSSGTLRVSGNINTTRLIELRQNGAVVVDSGINTTWGGIGTDLNGDAHILTKNGAGAIRIAGASDLSGLVVNSGMIDLGSQVNLNAGAANAITMNSGTAAIGGGTVTNSSGDVIVAASGNASELRLAHLTVNSSDANLVNVTNGSYLVISASNAILNGDLVADAASSGKVILHNGSVLTGKIDPLDVDIDSSSVWNVTANSLVAAMTNNGLVNMDLDNGSFKDVTMNSLAGSGTFKMRVAVGDDLPLGSDTLHVSGTAAGAHRVLIRNLGNGIVQSLELPMIYTGTTAGGFNGSTSVHQYQGSLDVGMRTASLQAGKLDGSDKNTWYLVLPENVPTVNTPEEGGGNGPNTSSQTPPPSGGQAVLGMVAAQQISWFDQDTLLKRMGELRLGAGLANFSHIGDRDWEAWARSYGSQYNLGSKVTGMSHYEAMVYGIDIGADKGWQIDRKNVLFTGVFGGYGRTDLDFKRNGSDGGSDGYYAGFYGTWMHEDGWYIDWVGKAEYFDNSFKAWDDSYNKTDGSYGNWAAGTSLELGRQFKFKDGWYVEPQLQASYVHFFGTNYQTGGDNQFGVAVGDGDTLQLRGGAVFGRTIQLNANNPKDLSVLQPYVKVFGVEQVSNGGKVTTYDGQWRPNTDGASAVVGAGIVWQIDSANQLHVDYEAQFASKYDKPWGVNVGFRHQF